MSLYADEDILPSSSSSSTPFPTDSHDTISSNIPTDPLQAFRAALILPAESPDQADALLTAALRFEAQPDDLAELCGQLLPMIVDGGESLLRSWTLDMVALAIGRAKLSGEVKLASQLHTLLP
jgi:symplekin